MSDELYPKIMTRAGVEISVGGAAEEAEKRAEGWVSPLDEAKTPLADRDTEVITADAVADASDVLLDEPTFGPPGDQTHRKRGGKKK